MINIFITLIEILIPILVFILLIKNKNMQEKARNLYDKTLDNLTIKLRNRTYGNFSYSEINRKLKGKGAYYIFREYMNPAIYIIIKILSTLLLILVGISISKNIIVATLFGILGFFLFDIILNISNTNDNNNMLTDIKNIVDVLKIQTNAGVHISQSIDTCYRITTDKRLKYELLELRNNILVTNDIITSINEFKERFSNEYIDTICIMLLQSQESGFSLQIMKDVSAQLADLQKVINIKKQESLDRKIQFIELLLFIGLLGICIYAMALELIQVLTFM